MLYGIANYADDRPVYVMLRDRFLFVWNFSEELIWFSHCMYSRGYLSNSRYVILQFGWSQNNTMLRYTQKALLLTKQQAIPNCIHIFIRKKTNGKLSKRIRFRLPAVSLIW